MATTSEAARAIPGARKVAVNKTDQVPCSHGGSILVEGDKTANKITRYMACRRLVSAKEKRKIEKVEGEGWRQREGAAAILEGKQGSPHQEDDI